MTPQETKRSGKPAIHSKHREVTGKNAHAANDYQGHAKQVCAAVLTSCCSV
jgi:hypothetical protein